VYYTVLVGIRLQLHVVHGAISVLFTHFSDLDFILRCGVCMIETELCTKRLLACLARQNSSTEAY
jgi:hypothetical protein